jgi:hypothetical protein
MEERERDAMALKLKEEGNAFFKNKDYAAAIEKYSEAMVTLLTFRLTRHI